MLQELLKALKELKPDNAQGELYLTDIVKIMNKKGLKTKEDVVWDFKGEEGNSHGGGKANIC